MIGLKEKITAEWKLSADNDSFESATNRMVKYTLTLACPHLLIGHFASALRQDSSEAHPNGFKSHFHDLNWHLKCV